MSDYKNNLAYSFLPNITNCVNIQDKIADYVKLYSLLLKMYSTFYDATFTFDGTTNKYKANSPEVSKFLERTLAPNITIVTTAENVVINNREINLILEDLFSGSCTLLNYIDKEALQIFAYEYSPYARINLRTDIKQKFNGLISHYNMKESMFDVNTIEKNFFTLFRQLLKSANPNNSMFRKCYNGDLSDDDITSTTNNILAQNTGFYRFTLENGILKSEKYTLCDDNKAYKIDTTSDINDFANLYIKFVESLTVDKYKTTLSKLGPNLTATSYDTSNADNIKLIYNTLYDQNINATSATVCNAYKNRIAFLNYFNPNVIEIKNYKNIIYQYTKITLIDIMADLYASRLNVDNLYLISFDDLDSYLDYQRNIATSLTLNANVDITYLYEYPSSVEEINALPEAEKFLTSLVKAVEPYNSKKDAESTVKLVQSSKLGISSFDEAFKKAKINIKGENSIYFIQIEEKASLQFVKLLRSSKINEALKYINQSELSDSDVASVLAVLKNIIPEMLISNIDNAYAKLKTDHPELDVNNTSKLNDVGKKTLANVIENLKSYANKKNLSKLNSGYFNIANVKDGGSKVEDSINQNLNSFYGGYIYVNDNGVLNISKWKDRSCRSEFRPDQALAADHLSEFSNPRIHLIQALASTNDANAANFIQTVKNKLGISTLTLNDVNSICNDVTNCYKIIAIIIDLGNKIDNSKICTNLTPLPLTSSVACRQYIEDPTSTDYTIVFHSKPSVLYDSKDVDKEVNSILYMLADISLAYPDLTLFSETKTEKHHTILLVMLIALLLVLSVCTFLMFNNKRHKPVEATLKRTMKSDHGEEKKSKIE